MSELDDSYFIQCAIQQARKALNDGNGPFGAVLVKDGKVIASAHNRTISEGNPTAHAEMVAIRKGCQRYGSDAIMGSTMFTSCEPCPMCLVAMYYAQVSRIVFAATLADAIQFGSGDPPLFASKLNEQLSLKLRLEMGAGREDVIALFEQYLLKYGRL